MLRILTFRAALSCFLLVGWASTLSAYVTAQRAAVVIGQANMTSKEPHLDAESYSGPKGVQTDGTRLFVADYNHSRVLIYNSIPSANHEPADVVLGQPNMTSAGTNNGGIYSNTLNSPRGVFSDGTRLFIADTDNNRVLMYDGIPGADHAAADAIFGQSGPTDQQPGTAPYRLDSPHAVFSDGECLYISDYDNNRVLIFNSFSNSSADVVVGQADMYSKNLGSSAAGLYQPEGIYSDGLRLFVADSGNNRVLIYSPIPAANQAEASRVIGQPNLTSNAANNGGLSASSLMRPTSVCSDGMRLFVVDAGNNRILVYNGIPTINHTQADYVIGQTTMTASNYDDNDPARPDNLCGVFGICTDGARLIASDSNAERIAELAGEFPAGTARLEWNCAGQASGIYLARVHAGMRTVQTVKVAVSR